MFICEAIALRWYSEEIRIRSESREQLLAAALRECLVPVSKVVLLDFLDRRGAILVIIPAHQHPAGVLMSGEFLGEVLFYLLLDIVCRHSVIEVHDIRG